MQSYLNGKSHLFIINSIFFLFGAIAAVLLFGKLSSLALYAGSSSLAYTVICFFAFDLLAFLFSFTCFGLFLIPALSFIRGFSVSITVSFLVFTDTFPLLLVIFFIIRIFVFLTFSGNCLYKSVYLKFHNRSLFYCFLFINLLLPLVYHFFLFDKLF